MYRTRLATRHDAEALAAIYNVEVRESTVTFDLVPRSIEEQIEWIDEHAGGHPALVAVDETGAVAGFASLTPYRSRPAYAPTVEDSVYVRRDLRAAGVGRLLLGNLVDLARDHGFHSVMARIVGGHDAFDCVAPRVRFRRGRRGARSRTQVRPVARRGADAADVVTRRGHQNRHICRIS